VLGVLNQAQEEKEMKNLILWQVRLILGILVVFLVSPVPAQASPTCVQPPASLVSWWSGDGNANDVIGGNHGTLQKGAMFAAGMVGQAFSFVGGEGTVVISPVALNGAFNELTIDAWVFPLSHGEGRTILSKTEFDGFALRVHDGFVNGDLRLTGGDVDQTFTQTQLPLSTWSHVAISYDGSMLRGYLNGSLLGSFKAQGTIRNIQNANVCLMIGNEPTGCAVDAMPTRGWHGIIDEVDFYNRALTSSEIKAIFDAGSAGKCKSVCTSIAVKPHTFTTGTPAKAAEVNADFDMLYQQINTQNCQLQTLNSQLQALKAIVCKNDPTASVCQ